MEFVLINIDEIVLGDRIRKDVGNIEGLKKSIETLGLLQPIGVTRDKKLVYGGEGFKSSRI